MHTIQAANEEVIVYTIMFAVFIVGAVLLIGTRKTHESIEFKKVRRYESK